jgi:muconolactone D-isomerase
MLFHIVMNVQIPQGADPDKIKQVAAAEHDRAKELQLQGKWVHLWRVAGKYASISVFNVESPDELHEILNSLPLYPFMQIEVTALCRHPGSLEQAK